MSQAQLLAPTAPSPSVSLVDGRPATSSQEISNFFGKRHDSVVRSIQDLMDNCPESFRAHNFVVTFRSVPGPNGSSRQERVFILYRDGFMLLVMGYTGKKALAMKLAYIDAFNRMESQIAGKALPATTTPSSAESRKPLRALVHAWSQVTGVHHAALWPQVKAHFQLSRIDDLPEEWIPDALAFVQQKIDEASRSLPGTKALPARSETPALSQGDGLPPDALEAMTDSQRAKRFRRLMEEVRGLAQKVGSTMDMVRFTTHPGARYVRLAPELDARYNALDQMHKIAVAGLYQAEHMLYCLYFLGKGVEFK